MEGNKIVAVSGYFNPLHVGHIEMFRVSKLLGDYLVVIVNNDYQVKLKGTIPFMNEFDRLKIVSSIRYVDEVFLSIDGDKTVCKSLKAVHPYIFAKGGDRKICDRSIPEMSICEELGIIVIDNVCPQLRQSSEILKKVREYGFNNS